MPAPAAGQGFPVDFYLYVAANGSRAACSSGGVAAYAAACDFEPASNRPQQGFINICPPAFFALSPEAALEAVVHELTHALVRPAAAFDTTHIPLALSWLH